MPKRNTQVRRRQIIEQLNRDGKVTVESLAKQFFTSEVTIRKDLSSLEGAGLLLRRHGGAIPLPQDYVNESQFLKVSNQKILIAKAAANLIRDHNRIIIDSGNTTASLLPELSRKHGLVVMTNALDVAHALKELENEPTLLMTGGTWDARSESFQGQLAEQVLRAYDFDQLFIGADGLDIERGTTTYNELYHLSRVMADVSREVIVLAESDKLGRKMHNVELSWSCINTLITDSGMGVAVKQQIQAQGVDVVFANET